MVRVVTLTILIVFPLLSHGQASPSIEARDKALESIQACLHRNEVSSRECKHLNQQIETLTRVYRGGDKSVLPTLFRFTYLTEFYDEALLSDSATFLAAMSGLSEENQYDVALGIAGGMFGLRSKEKFDVLRALLRGIPDSSQTKTISQLCLSVLERNNASLFIAYFPPDTWTDPVAEFRTHRYSRDIYALGEKPLWPPVPNHEATYRFTYLGSFIAPQVVILTIHSDGTGEMNFKTTTLDRNTLRLNETRTVSHSQLDEFLSRLDQVHFWTMSTEGPTPTRTLCLDGSDWILEALRNGTYHIVARWCLTPSHPAQDIAFADAAGLLLELAGHKDRH